MRNPNDEDSLNISAMLGAAKRGDFDSVVTCWNQGADKSQLGKIFDKAITDFRTVKRNPGHLKTLKFCVDQGLDPMARIGWMSQPLICTCAMYGNTKLVEYIIDQRGYPEDSFARASLGDVAYLESIAGSNHKKPISELVDSNGFNLLHYVAASGLGRFNASYRSRLEESCAFLLKQKVRTDLVVENEVQLTPSLMCAWFGGNPNIMRTMLDAGEIDANDLHQALEFTFEPHQRSGEPFSDVALAILMGGLDVNLIRPDQGRTLLHGASNRGAMAAVSYLLERGADPNSRDDQGRTPLHVAAIRNTHVSVVERLIAKGADIHARDSNDESPLDLAKANNREKIVQFLNSSARVLEPSDGIDKLADAVHALDVTKVKSIVASNPDLINVPLQDENGIQQTILHRLMPGDGRVDSREHLEILKLLLENGAEVNKLGEGPNLGTCTALRVAAWGGHSKLIQLLLNHGALINGKPGGRQKSPLWAAAGHGHSEAVDLLVENGAKYELSDLVMAGLEDRVGDRIDKDPEVINLRAGNGGTLLHAALETSHGRSMIPLLLSRGADASLADTRGRLPVHMAIDQSVWWSQQHANEVITLLQSHFPNEDIFTAAGLGNVELVKKLLDENPTLASAPQADGTTAMFHAVISGNVSIVERFIEANAELSPASDRFWSCLTPLHLAIQQKRNGIAKLLVENGADVNAQRDFRVIHLPSPLQLAEWGGEQGLIELLKANGAK